MSKRKHGPTIVPALSAKVDNKEKRFIQVGNSLLLSKQFHALSTGSRFLYFCMAMESGGRKNFILPQKDAKKYGIAPSSLRKHIYDLSQSRRFIDHDNLELKHCQDVLEAAFLTNATSALCSAFQCSHRDPQDSARIWILTPEQFLEWLKKHRECWNGSTENR